MKKEKNNLKKIGIVIFFYFAAAFIFYYAANSRIKYREFIQSESEITGNIGEVINEDIIEQSFYFSGDYLEEISLQVATYGRKNQGNLQVFLFADEILLLEKNISVSALKDNSSLYLPVKKTIEKETKFLLRIVGKGGSYGDAVTFYYNTEHDVHKGNLTYNNQKLTGELCMEVIGGRERWIGKTYWKIVSVIGSLIAIYSIYLFLFKKKENWYEKLCYHIERYKFLIKQLVSRDFKTKYKRSALGFCWSFLNPLLTMFVQYLVFSTIFKSDIENFPVYLLSAGILFNFFTESVGNGLGAIVGNTSLITKVYVPKFIYPFSRVLSTSINLFISLIPLLFAVIITGEEITKAFLLIPFVLICIILFCIGVSFILSSCMVFFRDTQFLWGIVSLIWMYATPIFYPETIIPEKFSFVLRFNPMYHYLKFFRVILMEGKSPELIEYIYCFGFAAICLVIGTVVFQKTQKKFVLYL